uniref:Lrp/AsnC family transcriptional regulator n=1 Tax=candidate division WOR-3 bacterium TaxID=2052148 RepID=A0A7C6EAL4_UNCW3
MQIDQIDLKIIRALENGNRPFLTTVASQWQIKKEEVEARVKKFEAERLIKGYKMIISIPSFLGGDWTLGCLLGIASNPTKVVSVLAQKLNFIIEVFHNLPVPEGIGPNLNILFYTQDFPTSSQIIKETEEFDYVEVYKLQEYAIPVPTILSSAEQELIRKIYNNPTVQVPELLDNQTLEWIEEKINQLLSPPNGIARLLPELDWQVCENFAHIHFLIEKGTLSNLSSNEIPESYRSLLKTMVWTSQPFQNRFYQVETDIWGVNDFSTKVKMLKGAGVKVKGFILAETNQIINDWISKHLPSL